MLFIYTACSFISLSNTSSVDRTSPNAKPKPFRPAWCCSLLAVPQASFTSHVSYPLLNALLAVVSLHRLYISKHCVCCTIIHMERLYAYQQQSVMTPHTTVLSTLASSRIFARSVLMKAS